MLTLIFLLFLLLSTNILVDETTSNGTLELKVTEDSKRNKQVVDGVGGKCGKRKEIGEGD